MSFNPDPTKQEREDIFSSSKIKASHQPLTSNDYPINAEKSHEQLGLILDEKLTLAEQAKEVIVKAKHGIGIIRFLAKYASRDVLDPVCKIYDRPHLDYGDVIYHH